MPEPRPADDDHGWWEVSGLLGIEEALAGLPADQLQDLARTDEIGGIDLLALGPARHRPDYRRPGGRFLAALTPTKRAFRVAPRVRPTLQPIPAQSPWAADADVLAPAPGGWSASGSERPFMSSGPAVL